MEGLAKFNFNLEQLYPEVGRFRINTCGNPDCGNFGRPPRHPRVKLQNGLPKNLSKTYSGTKFKSAPRFSWQRPTGRLHEPQFFAACVNELRAFRHRARRRLPQATKEQREERTLLKARIDGDIRIIRTIAEDWFGFTADKSDLRGSFRGMTTRDTYTKTAHFALLKEMLPPGRIILTTEQEATLPTILPHIFEDEIRQGRFT